MAQHRLRPHRRRALIVDDETSFGTRLQADMHALGYDVCDLATLFVTGYADRATIDRIQGRVPGASVLPKSGLS